MHGGWPEVISGEVSILKSPSIRKQVVIDKIVEGDSFGEVILFSDTHTYPASISG